MSRLRLAGILAAIAVLVTIAFLFGMHWAGSGTGTASTAAAQVQSPPPGVIAVPVQAQEEAGLATAPVTATLLNPTANAYAIAMDIRPLLAARQQIATAQAQVRAAESAERASRAEFERARKLFEDDRNVSQKAMQSAEAAWHADQGKLEAATAALHESEAAAAQQFGGALAGDAKGLVEVMLPAATDAAPAVVGLTAPGYPSSKAQRIGPAPRVEGAFAGRAFLYRSGAVYPAGLRLQADVPLESGAISGFVVPESAVVWYGNEPWVFVQAAPDRFVRRALKDPQATAGGTFTTTAFASGDRIVVRGAQLLQSEALKPRTPATSGCSDPECDD